MNLVNPYWSGPKIVDVQTLSIAGGVPSPGVMTFARAPLNGELVIVFTTVNNSDSPAAPSGFTGKQLVFQGGRNNWSYYRFCNGTEGTSFNIPWTNIGNDFKEIYGSLINGATSFGTDRTRNDTGANASPQNVLASSVSVSTGALVLCTTQFSATNRNITSVSNGFSLGAQATNQKSFFVYKEIQVDEPTLNCSFSFGGGTTQILSNWLEVR